MVEENKFYLLKINGRVYKFKSYKEAKKYIDLREIAHLLSGFFLGIILTILIYKVYN